jgi:hypothetical protein
MLASYLAHGASEATVLLLRSGGCIFGGFAAEPWDLSDLYGGSTRSFLFSVTYDAKVPFHGRAKGPRQRNDELLRQQHEIANMQTQAEYEALLSQAREISGGIEPSFDEAGRLLLPQVDPSTGQGYVAPIPVPRPKPFVRHDALRSNSDTVAFGIGDLVLRGDFSDCASELEHSYGVGLRPEEARVLLAGSAEFKVDALELWAVSPRS